MMVACVHAWLPLACLLVAALAACASPVVKFRVLDAEVLARRPLPGDFLSAAPYRETVIEPALAWMATDTRDHLVFVGYRPPSEEPFFCQVLACEPGADRIVLQPLRPGEDPIEALAAPGRVAELRYAARTWLDGARSGRAGVLELKLSEVVERKLLGPPVPTPGRILAAAANFPSHLEHDLAVDPELFGAIARSRVRVFQKHPPVPAPGRSTAEPGYRGVIGPWDDVRYPELISLPVNEEGDTTRVATNLDYEVELGVVIGRRIDWDFVRRASDRELYGAVAGYVLMSDVKARNPQLFERAMKRGLPVTGGSPYLTGDSAVDDVLGHWDPEICQWWSYAASQGDYSSLGPYFVANPGAESMSPRALLCARTYGDPKLRPAELPSGREMDVFYLRQCSIASSDPAYTDAMLWDVPAILRGIVNPEGNVLERESEPMVLEPGDVVSLGTPGGVVLTVTDRGLLRFLDRVLFWWDALDWHDAFFGKDHEKYLHDGDQIFLWAEGLGFQRNLVRIQEEPQ